MRRTGDTCPESTNDRDDPLRRITTAARQLFATKGVVATRLEDVAQQVGMSRQYLYRFVSGRDEVVELVLTARCREVGAALEALAHGNTDDLESAIADHIVAGIRMGRDDEEFKYLAEAMDRARLNTFLTSANSPLHDINRRAFGPLLARAIEANILRTDVSVDAMVVWLQGVMTMLTGRDDLDDVALRETVRNFVLPSLLSTLGERSESPKIRRPARSD